MRAAPQAGLPADRMADKVLTASHECPICVECRAQICERGGMTAMRISRLESI